MDKLANDQGGYLSAIFVGMFRLTLTSFSWSTEYLARLAKCHVSFCNHLVSWGLLSVIHCPSSGNFSHFNILLQICATN
jgi:hypothetical protein